MSERSKQVEALIQELEDARRRVVEEARRFDDATWSTRPGAEQWSASENVAHLNLSSAGFLPIIEKAVANGPRATGDKPFRRDLMGWLLCKVLEPPPRMKVKTTAPFVPTAQHPRDVTLAEFDTLQSQLIAMLRRGADLDLGRIVVQSIFNEKVRYNLFACFKVIAAHERRHAWQMAQARARLTAAGTAPRGG